MRLKEDIGPALNFCDRLPGLDGLRGIAILAVFLYHYAGSLGARAASTPLKALAVAFGLGWTGVDLFFVLSGFLITGILFDTLKEERYYRNFYFRRSLRIFPVYYFLIFILLASTRVIGAHWKPSHLLFLIYLEYPAALVMPALVHFSPVVLITHMWSLCV